MKEEQIKEWIGEIQSLHYNVIRKANESNITDEDQFEAWATKMAQLHTRITVALIFNINKANEQE